MSFALNTLASLLATLVVAGAVLFCSSAAQAHGNHGPAALDASVQVPADGDAVRSVSDERGDEDTPSVEAPKDQETGDHRMAGSSCCGTGVSNCMAAAVLPAVDPLQVPPAGTHEPARRARLLLGTVVDGLIRPPRALV